VDHKNSLVSATQRHYSLYSCVPQKPLFLNADANACADAVLCGLQLAKMLEDSLATTANDNFAALNPQFCMLNADDSAACFSLC
jgi:hypothetical protein